MPLSLLEAMSYGNCCVVSNIAECTDVVEDKACIFPKGNVEALAQCLGSLCADQEAVNTMKAQSSFVCGKYNWDDVTNRTLELYQ
jgi:glycosyltransferase involved in cell wall biosynthesis